MKPISVRVRATLITAVFLACASLILSAVAFSSQRASLMAESRRKVGVAVSLLAEMSAAPLQDGDILALAGIADRAARGQPTRVCIADRYGQILADSAHKSYDQSNPTIKAAMSRRQVIVRSGDVWEAAAPVIDHSSRLSGIVYITFSTQVLDQSLRDLTRTIAIFSFLSVLIGSAIAYWFGRYLSASFIPLLGAMRRMTSGDLGSRIPRMGIVELDEIGRAFNRMSIMVGRRVNSLERLNQMATDLSVARTVEEFASSVSSACVSLTSADCAVYIGEPASGILKLVGVETGAARVTPACVASIAARERRPVTIGMKADLAPHSNVVIGVNPDSAIVAPLITPDDKTLGILLVTYDWRELPSPDREGIANIAAIANLASPALEAIQRTQFQAMAVDALREILIPQPPSSAPGLEIYATYHAPEESHGFGGDYYDFLPLDDSVWGFAIGDVSGKGLEAGRYTAMAKYAVRSYALEGRSPSEVLTSANTALTAQMGDALFITLFFGALDVRTHKFTFSCGGHPPALWYSQATGTVTELETGSGVLGISVGDRFDEKSIDLRPGDLLVFYTDGLIEARRDGQQYGIDQVKAIVKSHSSEGLKEISEVLVNDVRWFARGGLQDDLALVLIRVGG